MKQCSACHKKLSLDNFYKDKSKKDGYRNQCKQCFGSKTRVCPACKNTLPSSLFSRKNPLCHNCQLNYKRCPTCSEIKIKSKANFYHNSSQPDYLDPHCIQCKTTWRQQYRSTTIGKTREQKQLHNYRQTEQYKQSQHRYKRSNKGREAYRRGWKKYYYTDKGQKTILASRKRWTESPNGRKITRYLANQYRVRKMNAKGSHTLEEFELLCSMFNHCCLCCGSGEKLTRDHIVPLSQGGSDDISNIQPLCLRCNSSKNTGIIDYRPYNVTRAIIDRYREQKAHPQQTDG